MRLDRSLPGVMTSGCGLDNPTEDYLPNKVANVSKDIIRQFPHTKRVGNYLLGRTLGEGSFAKVKEAMHTLTGEKVAIKVIDKKKAKADAYVRKNLRREGKLLQTVRHTNVISLLEIMETENSYYLVTELCQGGDLMDLICAQKRLDENQARKFTRQIISAIDYLHKAGILHRDLKVENLLLDHNKDIKIIDFGLSNSVRVSHTKEGGSQAQEYCVTQCGSPAYAAPELLGNKKYGPKVDIWSIGVNMYAMLTGNLPFTVEPFNIKALHNKMLNADMNPIPDHLSEECRDMLRKLLTPAPEERITLQQAMKHPWITDGNNRPMTPAPFPNKLSSDDLNHDIVKHMASNMDYRMSEVIRLSTKNIPNNATATYHLLLKKLRRYQSTVKSLGDSSGSRTTTPSSSKQAMRRSAHADAIKLNPVNKSHAYSRVRQSTTATGRDSPMRRKTDAASTTDHRKVQDTKSPRRTDTGSASEAEKTLVRRRITNARVLSRMQGDEAGSKKTAAATAAATGDDDNKEQDDDEERGAVIRRFTEDFDLDMASRADDSKNKAVTLPRISPNKDATKPKSTTTNRESTESASTSSEEGPKSMCSNPNPSSNNDKTVAGNKASLSDPSTHSDKKSAQKQRPTAKKVVLDMGSYNRFSRNKDMKKSLPSVITPGAYGQSPSRPGPPNRRLVNVYPASFNSRSPQRSVGLPARTGRGSLSRNSFDNSLNVLGEKAGVRSGRGTSMTRSLLSPAQLRSNNQSEKPDNVSGGKRITLPSLTPPSSGRTRDDNDSV